MSFAVRPIGLVKSAFVFRQTISSDATNYVLRNAAITAGWDGIVPLDAEVTVASGIVLSANSTSLYGFDTGTGFPAGTTLKLIMPGYVCGMGGAGGNGAVGSPTAGAAGGPALRAQHAITIDATGGVIAGGGGGGGGADARFAGNAAGGGGGGRSGRTGPAGGSKYGTVGDSVAGSFSSGGDGGYGVSGSGGGGTGGTTSQGGNGTGGDTIAGGGGGGGWGAAGGNGGRVAGGSGGSGGAGGAAVVGNSYITWINTGTRYGAIT